MDKRSKLLLGTGAAIAVLAAVNVVAFLILKEGPPEPTETTSVPPEPPAEPECGGKACLPVPSGIKGLSFGMSRQEAAAALGEKLEVGASLRVPPRDAPSMTQSAIPLAGSSSTVKTSLGAQPASCRIDFDGSEKLVGIVCRVDDTVVNKGTAHELKLYDAIRESLVRLYGRPHLQTGDKASSGSVSRWASGEASLVLVRDEGIELENFSTTHLDAIAAAANKAQKHIDDATEHKRLAEEARLREEKRQADEAKRALDRDLGTSAERPR